MSTAAPDASRSRTSRRGCEQERLDRRPHCARSRRGAGDDAVEGGPPPLGPATRGARRAPARPARDRDEVRGMMLSRLRSHLSDWRPESPADLALTLVELLAAEADRLA